MANEGPLIDFSIIEPHKENIQSLPSGRSAARIARLYSPPLTSQASPHLSLSPELQAQSDAFEAELAAIDEADDPLDIYVRYTSFLTSSFPSHTSTSPLIPVLETVTSRYISSAEHKNDARYLKLWLQYLTFHDTPREVFIYLARNGVGAELALFYEEYAAWLEGQGRWAQAAEVYEKGVERGARPVERLARKQREFERRREAKGVEEERSDSPALPMPIVRRVLGEKVDGGLGARQGQETEVKKGGKKKMEIFKEEAGKDSVLGSQDGTWDGIGTLQGRKKENLKEAGAWAGQTLKVGKTNAGVEKLQIFKALRVQSSSPPRSSNRTARISTTKSRHKDQVSTNARNGKREVVHIDLCSVYPAGAPEKSFEEAMASHRNWLAKDWAAERQQRKACAAREPSRSPEKKAKKKAGFEIFQDSSDLMPPPPRPLQDAVSLQSQGYSQEDLPTRSIRLNDENNENAIARSIMTKEVEVVRRMRKEEKANRTRKIKMTEVRQERKETQTVQLNLASPTKPKIKRKRSAEPTMTVNTREAMDEIYGIFNQPIAETKEEESKSSDDDYTSGGESTTTGHISASASEYGDDTRREILNAQINGANIASLPESEAETADADDKTEATGWTDFTPARPALHSRSESEVDGANDMVAPAQMQIFQDDLTTSQESSYPQEDLITPIEQLELVETEPRTMYIPLPPEDYEPPVSNMYRDREAMANNRLPFMTPIAEATESSIGTTKSRESRKSDYFSVKTPSRLPEDRVVEVILEDDDDDGVATGADIDRAADALLSSPFQEQVSEARREKQDMLAHSRVRTNGPVPVSKVLTPQRLDAVLKGPIIQELQVNPCHPDVREEILARMRPSLSSYAGFHDHGNQDCGRIPELRRYVKAVAAKKSSTLETAPVLSLAGSDCSYAVRRELGAGAFAPVYLVDRHSSAEDDQENHHPSLEVRKCGTQLAMKVETSPPSPWEFQMISLTHRRLNGSRPSQSIVSAHECHLFRDASFLLEDYADTGTLLDVINLAKNVDGCHGGAGAGLDESLAMFFAIELIRIVEGMHRRGLIHGDLKADNVMLRLPASGNSEWGTEYEADGSAGWEEHGVTLIDFGRGIDMEAFRPDVKFEADWQTSEADCVEMRELRPWTYQVDYHGLAGTIHTLLFGKYMVIVPERGEGGGERGIAATKRWRIREGLKRYWQLDIWGELFGMLLNSTHPNTVVGEDGGKMPLLKGLRQARERMEAWLESGEGGGRDGGLRAKLKRIEDGAVNARKAKR